MKAVLLLAIAVGSLGSPLYMAQLYEGFSSAAEPLGSCYEKPEECGRALAHIVSLMRENVLQYATISWDPQAFFNGLIQGLQDPKASNSACYSDFTQTLTNFASFFNALIHFDPDNVNISSIAALSCDGKSIFGFDYEKDCEFNVLIDNLKTLSFDALVSRYLGNMCPANLGIVALQKCANDQQACGFGVGTLIRIELDWHI